MLNYATSKSILPSTVMAGVLIVTVKMFACRVRRSEAVADVPVNVVTFRIGVSSVRLELLL